ncbi:zinc ABC transporter substrate-binding protein [Microbacterium kribbense]|uniref:Zinc ABC transporter substrate-binding protein n=1 Tax=Microbacterium kribbense TaxID=433645 RepID=A0ABP7G2W0_9MICO
MRRRLTLMALATAAMTMLAGCAATPAGDPAAVQVVASTNVYGSIAAAVGGDRVQVKSVIDSMALDPHEFEAGAQDQLLVARADLVIDNGGGFDPFMNGLVKASGTKATVLTAVTLSPEYSADGAAKHDADHALDHLADFNEHVFYDPAVMGALADRIAAALTKIDPAGATEFAANAKTFDAGIAAITAKLGALRAAHGGAGVFVTEPLPLYLTDAAGLANKTPDAFSQAVEDGQDVAPAILLQALRIVSSGQAAAVIVNAQAGGPETTQVAAEAKKDGIPVISFSELLPDGTTYLTWMTANVQALAGALG